jgi:hypothetical protein
MLAELQQLTQNTSKKLTESEKLVYPSAAKIG